MKVATYQCDAPGCTAQKLTANHWLSGRVLENGALLISPWAAGLPRDGDQHWCSDACTVKSVQKYLSELKARADENSSSSSGEAGRA